MPAFALAWAQDADAIECDVRMSRDGQIVCIHDDTTRRVSGVHLVISESTFDDLRELDVGAWRGKQYRGTTIPTLSEVVTTVPNGRQIFIEIKSDTAIVPRLLEEIARAGLQEEQVTVISFNTDVLRSMRRVAPQFRTLWLSSFKDEGSGTGAPSLETVRRTLKDIGADGISSGKDNVGESFIRSIMAEGYEYHVWTVDDPETARRFKKWGAMSITTNVPGDMRQELVGTPPGV